MGNWGEFQQRPKGPAPAGNDPDFDDLCALVLTGSAGQRLIEALRARYIDAPENPQAPEASLRVRVTQQQFVRELEQARDRGLDAARRRSEEAAKPTS